eukprot:CAMPEP_0171708434 /NCGR_PEP_ID=MMETSP0991-20121206/14934_1 /TAXON_ID=483369 /ORGANISM="non described non described, Strain CCMP2098" /LENGTH=335 /DNA_ID=CAMNT_0012298457 /DNA_START=205 /DNA_END=1212 /DNA_ORIENTATION=+
MSSRRLCEDETDTRCMLPGFLGSASVHVVHTPSTPPARTALCVVGLVRGLVCKELQENIRKVAAAMPGGGDVFAFLKEEDGAGVVYGGERARHEKAGEKRPSSGPSSAFGALVKLAQKNALGFLQLLGAVKVIIVDAAISDAAVSQYENPSCPLRGFMEKKFAIVSLDQESCFTMIKAEEKRRGSLYDVVAKLRSDMMFCDGVDGQMLFKAASTALVETHTDHASFMPRAQAEVFFSAAQEVLPRNPANCSSRKSYDVHCHVKSQDLPNDVPNECLLNNWFQKNNLKNRHISYSSNSSKAQVCLWHEPKVGCQSYGEGGFCALHCTRPPLELLEY